MRTVTTSECNSFEEVRKLFERAFGEIDDINFVIAPTKEKYLKEIADVEAKAEKRAEAKAVKDAKAKAEVEELIRAQAIIDKVKNTEEAAKRDANKRATELKEAKKIIAASKKKGSVLVKTLIGLILFVFVLCSTAFGYVTTDINYEIASSPHLLERYLRDSFANLTSNSFLFTPTDTAPTATEGMVYYNDTAKNLRLRTDAAWVDIDVSGASSLDTAYGIGSAITVDTSAVTLTTGTGDNTVVLAIVQNETDNNNDAVTITMGTGATGDALYINGVGSGIDVSADNWEVANTGVGTFLSFVLENSETIDNADDGEITFSDGSDDTAISWSGTTLEWTTDTSIVTVDWGDLDSHTGLDDITFDAAGADNTITLAGSTTAKDLTIQQTVSAADASLILQSTGTGTDALSLISSVADISLVSADNITRTAADDITDTLTDGGYTLTIGGSTLGKYISTVADTYSMIAVDTVLIQNTEASKDITINSVLGAVVIEGEEDAANAVLITADGGTNTTMKLHNDTGTGAASIYALSDVGGITLTTSAAGKDILVNSVLGNVRILGEEDAADAVLIEADGGTNTTLRVWNDTGTGVASVDIDSDVGGITISANAAGKDVNIDSVLGSIDIKAEENAANAVLITVDGDSLTTMKLHNDTGTDAASIYLLTDVGGITQTASAGAFVFAATGASAGDWTVTIGDEYILNVTGGVAINSAEAAQDAVDIEADNAGGGITLDAGTLGVTFTGAILKNYARELETEAATSETVLAADSGKVFIAAAGQGTTTYTLPTAAAGLVFTFVDVSAVAGDDIRITASALDSINGGTVAKYYENVTDAVPMSVTLQAVSTASWEVTSQIGTWQNTNG